MSLDAEIRELERRQKSEDDPRVTERLNELRRRRGDPRSLICTTCRDRDPFHGAHDDVRDGATFTDGRTGIVLVRDGRSWLSRDPRPSQNQWCPLHNVHLWDSTQGYDPRPRDTLGPVERAVRDGRDPANHPDFRKKESPA